MADTYTGTYQATYGDAGGGPVGGGDGDVNLSVTVFPDRPTATLVVTNNDNVAHEVTVTRSAGVKGKIRFRWIYRVTLGPNQSMTAIDDEAPLGVPFVYGMTLDGVLVSTSQQIKHTGPWQADGHISYAWLRHLTLPGLSMPVQIDDFPSASREGRYGEHVPLNSGLPVVTYYPRGGRAGGLTLHTLSQGTAEKLSALLDDGSPLQLATHPRFNVLGGGMYLAVKDLTEGRPTGDGDNPERTWTLDCIEIDAPPAAGNQGGVTTYADLLAAYATYGALRDDANAKGWTYREILTEVG